MKQYVKILAVIIAFEIAKQMLKDYEETKLKMTRIEHQISDIKREYQKSGVALL